MRPKVPLVALDSRKSKGTLPVEVDHAEQDPARLLAEFRWLRGELGTRANSADEDELFSKEAGHHDRQSMTAILMVPLTPAGPVSWEWGNRPTSKTPDGATSLYHLLGCP